MSLSPKRIGRVTASRVGAILGLSPFQTADDVLRAMVREYHGAEPEFKGNVATEWGNQHEAKAISELEFDGEVTVLDTGEDQKFYPYEDWLGATPDGRIAGWPWLVEVKCPYSARITGAFRSLDDQPHYYAQMQVAMLCANMTRCTFVQWSPSNMKYEVVFRNDAWPDENLPKLKAFHERYLSELDNPAHLKPLRGIVSGEDAAELLAEYDQAKIGLDAAQNRVKEALAAIVDYAGGEDSEVCGRKLTRVVREGSISYAKALKDIAPDADLESYRGNPSEYWKLT